MKLPIFLLLSLVSAGPEWSSEWIRPNDLPKVQNDLLMNLITVEPSKSSIHDKYDIHVPSEPLISNYNQIDKSKTPTVLVLGGAFNPITRAHINTMKLAKIAAENDGTRVVMGGYFAPASKNYAKRVDHWMFNGETHKQIQNTRERVDMINLAIQDDNESVSWMMVSNLSAIQEADFGVFSILQYLSDFLVIQGIENAKVMFVVGTDNYPSLIASKENIDGTYTGWYRGQDLIRDFGLIVIEREESTTTTAGKLDKTSVAPIVTTERNGSIIHISSKSDLSDNSSSLVRYEVYHNGYGSPVLLNYCSIGVIDYMKSINLYGNPENVKQGNEGTFSKRIKRSIKKI